MRVNVISVLVSLALCFSLVSVLAMPATRSVEANPFRVFDWQLGEMTSNLGNNVRSLTIEPGTEIVQFAGDDLIMGSGVIWGGFCTAGGGVGTVSGAGMQFEMTSYFNSPQFTCNCQPTPDGGSTCQVVGYAVSPSVYDDRSGNRFGTVSVGDLLFDGTYYPTNGTNYMVSTWGQGIFGDSILIGKSVVETGSDNIPVSTNIVRWYAGPTEISGPYPIVINQMYTSGNAHALASESSQNRDQDEYIQFDTSNGFNNFSTPAADAAAANYVTNVSGYGTVFGGYAGDNTTPTASITTTINYVQVPSNANRGWSAGTFTYTGYDGTTIHGSLANDFYGKAYMFATLDGTVDGKEYYMEFQPSSDPLKHTMTGSLYVLEQSESQLWTATNTGYATLVPTSGTMENLRAVNVPSEAVATQPANIAFPHGLFEFNIAGLTDGESVTVMLTLPQAVPATARYWKYGPTPSNHTPHWYQIAMGDNDGDNVITITLVDGGLGDDDLEANGTIVDQGGPGWPWPSGGGGGHSAPVFPSIYIGIGAALGAGILAYSVRRRMGNKVG